MSDPNPQPKSFWTRPVQAAAVIVAVIAIAGIVLSLLSISSREGPDGHLPASDPTSATPPEPVCPDLATDADHSPPTAAPDTQWTLVGRMAAPSVENLGPARVDDDGWRHCYANTPTGALVAAANLIAMTTEPDLINRIAQDGIMPGDLRDRALATPDPQDEGTTPAMQIRGFRSVGFAAGSAVIDLAVEMQGMYASVMVALAWHEGDWRLAVRGQGATQELDIDYSSLPSLYGYVPWAGA